MDTDMTEEDILAIQNERTALLIAVKMIRVILDQTGQWTYLRSSLGHLIDHCESMDETRYSSWSSYRSL